MRKKLNPTEKQIQDCLKLRQQGLTIRDISLATGVPKVKVTKVLKDNGIEIKRVNYPIERKMNNE